MSDVNRRRFLAQAGAGALALAAAKEGLADDAKDALPIVDTHQHLWDIDRFTLPWLKNNEALNRSFSMADYQKAAEGLNIVKSVYMEVDVDSTEQIAEAENALRMCRRGEGPLAGAVISGRPISENFGSYLDLFKNNRYLKGVRQVLHPSTTPRGYCLDRGFMRGMRELGKRALTFDLCMRPGELVDGLKLIVACPETSFVLDHCGNPNVQDKDLSVWKADISRLAERPNIVCKVSGIVASADPKAWTPDDLAPVVNHVLSAFGPDRVLFGGDWPVCTKTATLRQWVEALKTIVHDRSQTDQRKLFHENALRVYRLT